MSVEEARLLLWPRNPVVQVRTGMKYFKMQRRAEAQMRWPEPQMRKLLSPYGYTWLSDPEIHAREKIAFNKTRGKMPTRKGEGKKKSRRK